MHPNSNNVNMLTKLLETWNPRQTTANTIGRPRDNFIIVPQNPEEGGKINGFPRIYLRVQNGVCTSDRQKQTKTGPFNQDYRMNKQSGKSTGTDFVLCNRFH